MSIKMCRMLFLRCMHTPNTLIQRNILYIYSIKVCIRSVKIFSFCSLSPSFSVSFPFSLSLSFFTRFTRFVSLDRPRIVSSNSKKEKEKWERRRRGRRRSIIVLNRLFFLLLSTVWWTQVIKKKEGERERKKRRLKSFDNYACVSLSQG